MPSDRKSTPKWVRYSGLGIEFGAVVVGLTLLGAWADRHFGIYPMGTLAGFGSGLFGGLYRFARSAQRAMSEAGRSEVDDDRNG